MTRFILILFTCIIVFPLSGQDSPLDYMEAIHDSYEPVLKKQLDFATAMGQGQLSTVINKKRSDLLSEIRQASDHIRRMPSHRGNKALRDSVVQFLSVNYDVVNEDYARLVDLERISEDSYDQMEIFLKAQEKAYQKLGRAASAMKESETNFARQFGIKLVNSDNKFAQKLENLNKTFTYYNEVYLLFFDAYQQELHLFRAIEKRDSELIKNERRVLQTKSETGLRKLDKIGNFEGDRSLKIAAQKNLNFYKSEAMVKVQPLVDYYEAVDEINAIKSRLEAELPSDQRKELTSDYNERVKILNASSAQLDDLSATLNLERAQLLNDWNNDSRLFLQKFIQ